MLAEGLHVERLSSALASRELWLELRGEKQATTEHPQHRDELQVKRARLRAAVLASPIGVNAVVKWRAEHPHRMKEFPTEVLPRGALEAAVKACEAAGEAGVVHLWTEFETATDALVMAVLPTSLYRAIALSNLYEVSVLELWPQIVRGHQEGTALFQTDRGYRYSVYAQWWLWKEVASAHHPLRSSEDFEDLILAEIRGPREQDPVARARVEAPMLERELKATINRVGERTLRVADVLHRLGRARANLEEPSATELYEKSLRTREELLGADHFDVAGPLLSLSSWYSKKNFELAEQFGTRALRIYENHPGKGDSFAAAQLNNLGNLYRRMKRTAEAEAAFLRAIELNERAFGPSDRTGLFLENLRELYEELGRLDDASRISRRLGDHT